MPDTAEDRAVLFDAVGTLIYADPPVAEVYAKAAQSCAVHISVDQIAARFRVALSSHLTDQLESNEEIERRRWRAIVANVFHDSPDIVDAVFDHLWQHFAQPQAWRVFDDVEHCLQELQSRGFRLAIASNFDARLHQVCLGHAALRDLPRYCSSEIGYAKPHGQFFRRVENHLGRTSNAVTLIGDDRDADYHGAKSAGWNAVLIDRRDPPEHGRLSSLAQLPAMLAHGRH
jgi:putative hydrolase of the HAD superfamily